MRWIWFLVISAALAGCSEGDAPLRDAPGDPVAVPSLPVLNTTIDLTIDAYPDLALFDPNRNCVFVHGGQAWEIAEGNVTVTWTPTQVGYERLEIVAQGQSGRFEMRSPPDSSPHTMDVGDFPPSQGGESYHFRIQADTGDVGALQDVQVHVWLKYESGAEVTANAGSCGSVPP